MVEAMTEYDQGNYNRTVELLYPLRYRLVEMGGSDAQVRSLKRNPNPFPRDDVVDDVVRRGSEALH